MTTAADRTEGTICVCRPLDGTKTYYVWRISQERMKVEGVAELYVTDDEIVLEKASHETLVLPRADVFMVTCDLCSPPPFC